MKHSIALALALVAMAAFSQVPAPVDGGELVQGAAVDLTRPALSAKGGILGQASPHARCIPGGGDFTVPKGYPVVVMRKFTCDSPIGYWSRLEVAYNGEVYYMNPDALDWAGADEKSLATHSDAVVEQNRVQWLASSKQMFASYLAQFREAALRKSPQGVALVTASVYDVSKVTEGTGFEATVLNTGKKAIKYITFSVVGLNRVEDPVTNRLNGQVTQRIRGVGPIEPWTTATFGKDYMWHTDVVYSPRIPQIEVEFMDGSRTVIRNVDKVKLDVDTALHYWPK